MFHVLLYIFSQFPFNQNTMFDIDITVHNINGILLVMATRGELDFNPICVKFTVYTDSWNI